MEVNRLFDVIYFQQQHYPQQVCLATKNDDKWKSYSTSEVIQTSEHLAMGLIKAEVQPGDNIAVISYNRPEWIFTDFAIQMTGAIGVPLYPTITVDDYAFALQQSECKVVFVENKELYDKVKVAAPGLVKDQKVFSFDLLQEAPHWTNLLVENPASELKDALDHRKFTINTADLATIIYTSGTTGEPKGVMLSHANILSCVEGVVEVFKAVPPGYRTISFLPLCHIFERSASYTHIRLGTNIYFSDMESISENIKSVKPHYFDTVPRLLEKVYEKIMKKGYELTGIKKLLFFWAMKVAEKYQPWSRLSWPYKIKLDVANTLIFSKWREALGNNIVFVLSGAAALQPRLARIFWAAGIPIIEGYGLTEASPGISFSGMGPGNYQVGCVGRAMKNVQIKIAEDGEVLAKGPNVMQGYYKRPELTSEVLTEDGWLHTGDIGELDTAGFLKITDRKKEIFKTSGGKYIAPQPMENHFKQSLLIENIMILGENEKHPSALIVPDQESLKDWCRLHRITFTTIGEMIINERVIRKYGEEVEKYNSSYAQFEKIKKFRLLSEPWTIDGDELTPTLKLRRKSIFRKYSEVISSIYSNQAST